MLRGLQYLWVRSPLLLWRTIPGEHPVDGPAPIPGLGRRQRGRKWQVYPPERLGDRSPCPDTPLPEAGHRRHHAGQQRSAPGPWPLRRSLRGTDGAVPDGAFGAGPALSAPADRAAAHGAGGLGRRS